MNILFDFDGTLADTREGIIRTVQGTLGRMALPQADPAAVAKTIGLPLADCFRQAAAVPEARVEEACRLYRDIFPELALCHIAIFPGVLPTLDALRRRGIAMGIVSSRHRFSLDPLVRQLGIEASIPLSHVYGEDLGLRPKPAPDLALKALADLRLDAADTLVVGDTTFDLLMGSSAGCLTCGVTYGNQGRQQLLTARPNWLIDSFSELLAIVP